MTPCEFFISAGEPSGDLHAANLIRSLRKLYPDAQFTGFGGGQMKAAGVRLLYPLVDLAVMWFLHVFLNLFTFLRLVFVADRHFRDSRPDAVVLVDYPGLHWWIARAPRHAAFRSSISFPPRSGHGPAGASRRSRSTSTSSCAAFRSSPNGTMPAVFTTRFTWATRTLMSSRTGRSTQVSSPTSACRSGELVSILPGSRTQEVLRNLPEMIQAANKLAFQRPGVRFAVACLHERHQKMAEGILASVIEKEGRSPGLEIEIHAARTPELIRLARVAWAVSGSVGLELMVEALPSVVVYKIRRFDLWVASFFIKSRYISLVNLLADTELFPEYLTWRDVSDELVRWSLSWLDDPSARNEAREALATLRYHVARPGAADRAAESHRFMARARSREPTPATQKKPNDHPTSRALSDDCGPTRPVNPRAPAR